MGHYFNQPPEYYYLQQEKDIYLSWKMIFSGKSLYNLQDAHSGF